MTVTLPDWRMHDAHELMNDGFSRVASHYKSIVEYDDKGVPVREVSKVTSAYTFVPPRTWLSDIVNAIGTKLTGDVCVRSIQATHNTVLVELKLPMQFNLRTDSHDDFGLTMVATNPYSGCKKQTLGIGAIRGACTNGCIFGDHKKLQLAHRGAQGSTDALETYVHRLLEEAAPMAQGYLAKLVQTSLDKPDEVVTREYDVRKALHDGGSAVCRSIMQTDLPFWQKLLVAKTTLQRPGSTCSVYDLWNDFTNVASHQFPDKYKRKFSMRNEMLHTINRAFDTDGIVDRVLANDADATAREVAVVREQGWEKQWWWSFDPDALYGPHMLSRKRRRA